MPKPLTASAGNAQPREGWSGPVGWWTGGLWVLATAAYAITIGVWMEWPFHLSDVEWYLRLARGDIGNVPQPFASRQLGPAVVRLLAWSLHWTTEHAFMAQGVLSLLVTLTVVAAICVRCKAPRWLLLALAVAPFWPELFMSLALPDTWFAALLSVFLFLLVRERYMMAAGMMFPLMVSRESTSLVLVCFLIAAWRPLRWRGRALALACAVAGAALVAHLTAHSPGNLEHLPQGVYMLAKAPWNFLRNVVGVQPWSNLYPLLCRVPAWQHEVHAGPLRSIGVCGFDPATPANCFFTALTVFGMLPLFAVFLWRRAGRRDWPTVLRFSLLYGAVCFAIAPLLGVWVSHLFGYAWPLMFVALPMLAASAHEAGDGRMATAWPWLLGLHITVCGLIFLHLPLPVLCAMVTALYVVGYTLLRGTCAGGARSLAR